jgi:hypothetical protein
MDTYKPNIGWIFWVYLILVLAVVVALALSMVITWNMMPIKFMREVIAVVLIIVLIPLIISLLVLTMTMYTLADNEIQVGGAFGKRNIQYATVKKVIDTNKFVINEGMFVLSTDRIVIVYDTDKKVSISPRNKQDVLNILRTKCRSAESAEDLKLDKQGKRAQERQPLVKETGSPTVKEQPAAAKEEKSGEKFKLKIPGIGKDKK